MRRRICHSALVLAGLSLWAVFRWSTPAAPPIREYRIGADHAPPYHSLLPDGRVEGLLFDIMNAAAAQAGIRLRWVPWRGRIDEAFAQRAVDLWPGVTPNPKRLRYARFSEPWLTNDFVLISAGSRPRSVEGWNGSRVAVRSGPFLDQVIRTRFPRSPVLHTSLREDAIQAVCDGRAAVALSEARFLDVALLKRPAGCEGARFHLQMLPGVTSELRIMATPEAAAAAILIRRQIDELLSNGTFATIHERWSAFSTTDTRLISRLADARRRNRIYLVILISASLALPVFVLLYVRANHANRRAEEARTSAERANAAKSDFLAKMSHEIRTPLNGVIGLTELVLTSPLSPPVRRDLEIVKSSATELLDILSNVLDLSKIEAGRLRVETTVFDLRQLLDDVLSTFSGRAAERGIAASVDMKPGLHRWYAGDPVRLRQILANYVSNALKFSDRGSVRIVVTPVPECRLRISVVDTGIGVPEDKRECLFQEFSQVDSGMSRRYGGTGLGLAISRQLAGLLGGDAGYAPNEPCGSVFWVELPVNPEAPPPAPPPVATEPPLVVHPFEGARVLLAEDNSVNRLLATRLLTGFGCCVDAAVNGKEAVSLAEAGRYDLILMDCQMPELDGYEATTQLRRSGSTTPIVALTAHALAGDRERCLSAGMNDYLTKPLSVAALLSTLSRHLTASATRA
ncbi:MAG: response regulator [Bryobacteraceae bacterium]|nr:response regulator [Bryobacteraceae bacterium]